MATITVYLSKEEEELKQLLKELRISQKKDNPYKGLSESKIAGRILSKFLPNEHSAWVNKP